jgi:hypothetical protein
MRRKGDLPAAIDRGWPHQARYRRVPDRYNEILS